MSGTNFEPAYADAALQDEISDEQARFFLDNGFLVVKHVLQDGELALIQQEMQRLLDQGVSSETDHPDFMYGKGQKTGKDVLRRIEYVIDKSLPMRVLLGHPFILRSVQKLQGNNFIPTWDSMVVKMPDEGIIVPWHRDAEMPDGCADPRPVFNVDFYLDKADKKTCLWVIPGSNNWTKEACYERCSREGFDTSDAVPVPMEPGDVIFHNITVLHGSPSGDGNALRRTVYYEFRPGEIELEFGPHTRDYLQLKQQVLLECLELRKQAPYAQGEKPFTYDPSGELAVNEKIKPDTFRYPHAQYWRSK